ncbi:Glycosyl phosphatidyl inositol anchor synthesis, partial [Ceratobasidium sp. 370]
MRTHSTAQVLILGLVFHVVYIYSVFDCYFTSPVVHGMRQHRIQWPHNAPKKPPAKRVVLIVGDGLRADLLYSLNPFPNVPGSPLTVAPFLRSVAAERGAFGVSHTRVPTESRPGRWKTNPVDFDSVFNQSAHTFAYGSPDIVPMFARGVHPEDKVSSWCYDESEEDFTKDPDNTRTPLIAWGAGIRGPISDADFGSTLNSTHDSYSNPAWGAALTRLARADVQQADVAALMAALLGSYWPMNSVGVVPGLVDGPGYLKVEDTRGPEQMARIAVVNARAILEQYRVKHSTKASRHLRYKPFPPLAPAAGGALSPGALELRELERLLAARDWQTTRVRAKQLIDITLEGLGYLQRYDRYVLRFIVTAGYVGWMIFSALHVLHTHVVPSAPPGETLVGPEGLSVLDVLSITVLTTTAGVFAYQRSPWTYYLYAIFPIYFGRSILGEGNALYEVLEKRMDWGTFPTPEAVLGWGVGIVAVLECMVLAYTHRELWTVLFMILGVVWPLVGWPKNFYRHNLALGLAWTMSCLGSGVFTVLSVEKTESIALISLGAVAILFLGFTASQITTYDETETISSNRSLS